MGVLGDLSGKPTQKLKSLKDRKFIQIDRDNFDDVLVRMTPGLTFQVPNRIEDDGSALPVELSFRSMDGFGPDAIVKQFAPLISLLGTRQRLLDLAVKCEGNADLEMTLTSILVDAEMVSDLAEQLGNESPSGESALPGRSPDDGDHRSQGRADESDETDGGDTSLLDQVLSAARPRGAADVAVTKTTLRELIAASGEFRIDRDLGLQFHERIAQIDRVLSAQVSEILHHPEFQQLEGTWRGLRYLVMNSETSAMLKIKVLNVSKRELFNDVDKAVEFDQSQIFKKLYEHEFGHPGGEPYGVLIGDYEFTNHPEDIDMLSKMSNVAAAAFCPFIAAASPQLFGFE